MGTNVAVRELPAVTRDDEQNLSAAYVEPIAGGPVSVIPVSAVIGLHVGPAVGLCYETTRSPHAPTSSARRLLPDHS